MPDSITALRDRDTVTQQFVTFALADEDFGFPMDQVAEIIRLPETVSVPLAQSSLIGLANLRGNVLPILDLRAMLDLPAGTVGDATRVIVADVGRPVGLVVDKVAKVISADESQLEAASEVRTTVDSRLLHGVIRIDQQLIQAMDIRQLVEEEYRHLMSLANSERDETASAGITELLNITADASDDDNSISQLVSFTLGEQEYAFELMDVEEIVRVPDTIAEMPRTASHVLGLIELRGSLLPLVSLRRLFELEARDLNEQNRILVINLGARDDADTAVGVVVDEVREVLNVPVNAREAVPEYLNKNRKTRDFSAVCRLQGNKRLVSIIDTATVFNPDELKALVDDDAAGETDMPSHDRHQDDSLEDDTQMVIFKLAEQEYGVSIEDVQEITRVPDEMIQVPKAAEFIEGLMNLRGTVLPVLDMRTRFRLARIASNERQRILVLNLDGIRTGFIMDSIVEVLRLNSSQIEEAPDLSDEQKRMMGRVVNLKEHNRMIQVLDVRQLLDDDEQEVLADVA